MKTAKNVTIGTLLTLSVLGVFGACSTDSPTSQNPPAQTEYWYYDLDGSRVVLTPSMSLLTIKFDFSAPSQQYIHSLELATALSNNYTPTDMGLGFWQFEIEHGANLDQLIQSLLSYSGVSLVNPVIALNNGKLMYVSDQIILRFKSDVSQHDQELLLQSHGLTVIVPATEIFPSTLVSLGESSGREIFEVSRELVESGLCKYATPNCYGDLIDIYRQL